MFLLRKDVQPYEYMDEWGNFMETSLPEKEKNHSSLDMEDITGLGYLHTKRVYRHFDIKILDEYHDSYLKSNIITFG